MPTNTPDQQIPLPVDPDTADNPVAFNQFVGTVEQRLVRLYTDEADRTARMLTVVENELSGLASENRIDAFDGTNHVSLYRRGLHAMNRTTATQNVGPSNTTLQNLTNMVVAVPGIVGAVFRWRGCVFYDSATAADIKFAFTIPAGATMGWGGMGLASNVAGSTGDASMPETATSGAALTFGGGGVGVGIWMQFEGELTMAATAGNLQMQAAQQTSDATATTIHTRSFIECWRIL